MALGNAMKVGESICFQRLELIHTCLDCIYDVVQTDLFLDRRKPKKLPFV